jgi:hypothetical protein
MTTTIETKITVKRCISLVIEVEGGIVQAVYGDNMPEGFELDVVVRDLDNIEQGDEDPISTGSYPSQEYAERLYL